MTEKSKGKEEKWKGAVGWRNLSKVSGGYTPLMYGYCWHCTRWCI